MYNVHTAQCPYYKVVAVEENESMRRSRAAKASIISFIRCPRLELLADIERGKRTPRNPQPIMDLDWGKIIQSKDKIEFAN